MEHSGDRIRREQARTLHGLLHQRVDLTPQGEAYRHYDKPSKQWQNLSWQQFGAEVGRWQTALRSLGLEAGDRVAISLRNCPEWAIFDQAALGLGLVVVPLYTDDRPDNVAFILQETASKLLLLADGTRWQRLAPAVDEVDSLQSVVLLSADEKTRELDDERLIAASEWLPAGLHPLLTEGDDPNALASIIYTSGTTGRPKGVMLSHDNMLFVADAALQLVDIDISDRFLSFLPLSHTLERTAGYYLPMMTGACVAFSRSIPQLADDLQQVQPTVLISVPRIYERIYGRLQQQLQQGGAVKRWLFSRAVSAGWRQFERTQQRAGWHPLLLLHPLLRRLVGQKVLQRLGGRLRFAISGGAALPPEIARLFIGLGVELLQGYGLTETSPVIAVNTPEQNLPSSVGHALPGIEYRIGADHELQVRGPGVMLGYWNNHKATAEMIDTEGWLGTGDQARLDDGFITITGRIKDILVLSNGEKVPPGDMEMAISLDPLFEQVMVIGEGESFISALIVLNAEQWGELAPTLGLAVDEPASLEDKTLHTTLVRRIGKLLHDFPGYAKVRKLHLSLEPWSVENGLLTPTLKVKRPRVIAAMHEAIEQIYRSPR